MPVDRAVEITFPDIHDETDRSIEMGHFELRCPRLEIVKMAFCIGFSWRQNVAGPWREQRIGHIQWVDAIRRGLAHWIYCVNSIIRGTRAKGAGGGRKKQKALVPKKREKK